MPDRQRGIIYFKLGFLELHWRKYDFMKNISVPAADPEAGYVGATQN